MTSGVNKVLVAPARSGSTWVCQLLNEVESVVALDEPYVRNDVEVLDADGFASLVDRTFEDQRQMILESGQAFSTMSLDRNRLDNHYGDVDRTTGLRRRQVELGKLTIEKALPPDFTLVAKHTIPFAGIIDRLVERYPTYVLVRQPLEILASWNSIDAPYREGQIQPYAAALTGGLFQRLNVDDRLERQVRLLEWHFERFLLVDPDHVIRYEELVAARLQPIRTIIGECRSRAPARISPLGLRDVSALFARLMSRSDDSALFAFYPRDSLPKAYEVMLRAAHAEAASAM